MERRPRRRRALLGPLPAPWLLGLLLAPWPLQLTGGQSVTHTGPPILASLAHKAVSFGCSITYPYTPQFKTFTVSYFYVNRQGQESLEEQTGCQPSVGQENQTLTTKCVVTPKLPSASATGTYYCSVSWPGFRMKGSGTFILVRDTGYQEPPRVPQKTLFCSFIGILGVLSILGTVLLLWKKKQTQALWKHPARKSPAPSTASPQQSPAEPLYTMTGSPAPSCFYRTNNIAATESTKRGKGQAPAGALHRPTTFDSSHAPHHAQTLPYTLPSRRSRRRGHFPVCPGTLRQQWSSNRPPTPRVRPHDPPHSPCAQRPGR